MRSSGIRAVMRAGACTTAVGDYGHAETARNGSSRRIVLPAHLLRRFTPLSSVVIPPAFNRVGKIAAALNVIQPAATARETIYFPIAIMALSQQV